MLSNSVHDEQIACLVVREQGDRQEISSMLILVLVDSWTEVGKVMEREFSSNSVVLPFRLKLDTVNDLTRTGFNILWGIPSRQDAKEKLHSRSYEFFKRNSTVIIT